MNINALLRVSGGQLVQRMSDYLRMSHVEPIVLTTGYNEYVLLPKEDYIALIESSQPQT